MEIQRNIQSSLKLLLQGWNKQLSANDKINSIKSFIDRGLNEQEAEISVDGQQKITEYVMNNS